MNSLRSKIDKVDVECRRLSYVAFCCQETKLHPGIPSTDVVIQGYNLIRQDRHHGGANGGGVSMYIREDIPFTPFPPTVDPRLEVCGSTLSLSGVKHSLVTLYRPPSQTANERAEWIDALMFYLGQHVIPGHRILLCGDFNLNRDGAEAASLLAALEVFHVHPAHIGPTHGTRSIDWFATTPDVLCFNVTLTDSLEKRAVGHKVVVGSFTTPMYAPRPHCSNDRILWSQADWPRMAFMLTFNVDSVTPRNLANEFCQLFETSLDSAYCMVVDLLRSVLFSSVPVRRARVKRHPWIDRPLLSLIRECHSAFNASRRCPLPALQSHYLGLRKRKVKQVIRAKSRYAERLLSTSTTPAQYWESIRVLQGQSVRHAIPVLSDALGQYCSDDEKANCLSLYISKNYRPALAPLALYPDSPTPPEALVKVEFIEFHLGLLKVSSAPGLDGIFPRFLKMLRFELAPLVCALFNSILVQQSIPKMWRQGRVTPVPKGAPSANPSLYRPITIVPALSKVYETWLLELLEPFTAFNIHQFGFASKCGTDDAALRLQERVSYYRSLSNCPVPVAIVSLDLCKAFDTVQYVQILEVLRRRSCPTWLCNLVIDYLRDRSHVVKVGSALSTSTPLTSGVPQGTRIAPILFNVAIDEVFSLSLSPHTTLLLYADDHILAKPIFSPSDVPLLQKDVDKVVAYFESIAMKFNQEKSSVFVLRGAPRHNSDVSISMYGLPLNRVPFLRYLGYHLDEAGSFDHHWYLASQKARCQLGSLWHMTRRYNVRGLLPRVYSACILPALIYGLPVCTPPRMSALARINGVHRLAASMTLRIQARHVRSAALFRLLNWRTIPELTLQRSLLYMLRCVLFNRRLIMFLSCDLQPPIQNRLRSRGFRAGQISTLSPGYLPCPILPLSRIIELWNRSLFLRPCSTPDDVQCALPFLSQCISL